ncbi:hypothetical protein IWW34DRAFT_637956, partial [Fusarium oxysporum f. sp. albedinis]
TVLQSQQSAACLGMPPGSTNGRVTDIEAFFRCANAPPKRHRFAFHSPAASNRSKETKSKG